MVHGIHTLGVLGAVRAFDGSADSSSNFRALARALGESDGSLAFECYFSVDVLNGQVAVPQIETARIFPLAPTGFDAHVSDPSALPDLAQLREAIGSFIQVALDQAPGVRKPELQDLRAQCNAMKPDYAQCQRILEICRSSQMLPIDAIDEIRGVLSP
jgi:hypothetical protein